MMGSRSQGFHDTAQNPLFGVLTDLASEDVPGLGTNPDGKSAPAAEVRTPSIGPVITIALLGAALVLVRRRL